VEFGFCRALFGKDTLAGPAWDAVDPTVVIFPLTVLITVVLSLITRPADEEHPDKCLPLIHTSGNFETVETLEKSSETAHGANDKALFTTGRSFPFPLKSSIKG